MSSTLLKEKFCLNPDNKSLLKIYRKVTNTGKFVQTKLIQSKDFMSFLCELLEKSQSYQYNTLKEISHHLKEFYSEEYKELMGKIDFFIAPKCPAREQAYSGDSQSNEMVCNEIKHYMLPVVNKCSGMLVNSVNGELGGEECWC